MRLFKKIRWLRTRGLWVRFLQGALLSSLKNRIISYKNSILPVFLPSFQRLTEWRKLLKITTDYYRNVNPGVNPSVDTGKTWYCERKGIVLVFGAVPFLLETRAA